MLIYPKKKKSSKILFSPDSAFAAYKQLSFESSLSNTLPPNLSKITPLSWTYNTHQNPNLRAQTITELSNYQLSKNSIACIKLSISS